MPRVHEQVAREAKRKRNCGRCGKEIKSGDRYFWAKGRNQPKKYWCKDDRPRASELTGSDKLAMVYGAQETIDQALTDWSPEDGSVTDLSGALEEAAGQAREAAEAYEDSLQNMPEGLQQGPTGQDIEEKAGACNDWADELEDAAAELEDFDPQGLAEEDVDGARSNWEEEQRNIVESAKDALSL